MHNGLGLRSSGKIDARRHIARADIIPKKGPFFTGNVSTICQIIFSMDFFLNAHLPDCRVLHHCFYSLYVLLAIT